MPGDTIKKEEKLLNLFQEFITTEKNLSNNCRLLSKVLAQAKKKFSLNEQDQIILDELIIMLNDVVKGYQFWLDGLGDAVVNKNGAIIRQVQDNQKTIKAVFSGLNNTLAGIMEKPIGAQYLSTLILFGLCFDTFNQLFHKKEYQPFHSAINKALNSYRQYGGVQSILSNPFQRFPRYEMLITAAHKGTEGLPTDPVLILSSNSILRKILRIKNVLNDFQKKSAFIISPENIANFQRNFKEIKAKLQAVCCEQVTQAATASVVPEQPMTDEEISSLFGFFEEKTKEFILDKKVQEQQYSFSSMAASSSTRTVDWDDELSALDDWELFLEEEDDDDDEQDRPSSHKEINDVYRDDLDAVSDNDSEDDEFIMGDVDTRPEEIIIDDANIHPIVAILMNIYRTRFFKKDNQIWREKAFTLINQQYSHTINTANYTALFSDMLNVVKKHYNHKRNDADLIAAIDQDCRQLFEKYTPKEERPVTPKKISYHHRYNSRRFHFFTVSMQDGQRRSIDEPKRSYIIDELKDTELTGNELKKAILDKIAEKLNEGTLDIKDINKIVESVEYHVLNTAQDPLTNILSWFNINSKTSSIIALENMIPAIRP